MDKIRDAHYFQLSSQGNVYTLTNLQLANGTSKVLAASLKREVFYFDYPDGVSDILTPTTKEVLFTYIPGVAEIISIDAFNKSDTDNDFVIGITITKSGNDQPRENYLNIYSAWEATSDFNLDSIAQNCLNVELNFIPYHLYHTYLFTWEDNDAKQVEIVWMLSGGDEKVHVFREHTVNHSYKEIELKDCLPEFLNPPSIVMWMNVHYYKNGLRRISAYGCECGFVKLSVTDTKTLEILNSYSIRYENIISCVQVFKTEPTIKSSIFAKQTSNDADDIFHLLITNTILPSVVCMNVLEKGLTQIQMLEVSDYFNVASCSCLADIDFDGQNEILIGTYGQEVLVYKYTKDEWQFHGIKSFANPIYAMMHLDVTGDGINELIVLTMRGVHILQHDQDDIEEILEEKMKLMNI